MIKSKPLTIREIQDKKKNDRLAEQNRVCITNLSQLQSIPIQLNGKNSKKAINQITIMIPPGKNVKLPKYRLMESQIINLKKRGMISVDSTTGGITTYKDFLKPRKNISSKDESKIKHNKDKSKKAKND